MRHDLALLIASIALLAGCADLPPSEYSPTGIPTLASPEQQSAIERALRGQVAEPLDEPLSMLTATNPHYTAFLRRHELQGKATVAFVVEPTGLVGEVRVVESTKPELGMNATATVRSWRFKPPTRQGKPVRVSLVFSFNYRLH